MSAYPPLPTIAPAPVPGIKQATRRSGNLQAGTVRIGDLPDLEIFYSYATAIGYRVATSPAPVFTDAYYSVRTEAHAAEFGIRAKGAIVLADPEFRRMLLGACRACGLPDIPRADFTRQGRDTAFPDSPFFHEKRRRGENPRTGSYVYVVRDRRHYTGCDANGHGYRVKAIYMGIVRADDPERGWRKGQRKIRPILSGYGEATEAVDGAICETEGGALSFPNKQDTGSR